MLKPDLPHPPAFRDLRPCQPMPRAVDRDLTKQIIDAIGIDCNICRLTGGNDLAGCYVVSSLDGSKMMLKLVPALRAKNQRNADILALEAGEPAAACERLFEVAVDDHVAIAYPLVEGRRVGADKNDLYLLGKAIAEIHQGLRNSDFDLGVKSEAVVWLKYLDSIAKQAINDEIQNFPSAAKKVLVNEGMPFNPNIELEKGQILHGDLNYGNVLISENNSCKTVHILDFENITRSFGPTKWDVVFALERFCFPEGIEDTKAQCFTLALLSGYASVFGSIDWFDFDGVSEIQETIFLHSRRALAVLAAQVLEGNSLQMDEVQKFLTLSQDVPRKANIIAGALDKFRKASVGSQINSI